MYLVAGGIVGGVLGTRISTRLAGRRGVLERAFSVVVLLVAVYVGIRSGIALRGGIQ
jgi:hypothetical protein